MVHPHPVSSTLSTRLKYKRGRLYASPIEGEGRKEQSRGAPVFLSPLVGEMKVRGTIK